jgi:nuclear cap-binding protein subunit 1
LDFVFDVCLLDFIILACLLIPSCLYFSLKDSRKECAFYLVSLPVSFRYEYLMAETIFSQVTYFILEV